MTAPISGVLKSSTGMHISDGPPTRTAPVKVVEGPPGPNGGTPVVAVPYDEWPPVNPVPGTLYLKLVT
jgi:hypothetical protein